jgi:hypothetical protein
MSSEEIQTLVSLVKAQSEQISQLINMQAEKCSERSPEPSTSSDIMMSNNLSSRFANIKIRWQDRGENQQRFLTMLESLYNRYSEYFAYDHYFVDVLCLEEFTQYVEQSGSKVLQPTCIHVSSSSGHAHVIVRHKRAADADRFSIRMSNFSRWLKSTHKKQLNKKTDKVKINNAIQLVNIILYIQTKEGKNKNGFYEHTHQSIPFTFENKIECNLFKAGPLTDRLPDFLEEEQGFILENNFLRFNRKRRICYTSDEDSE